MTEDTSILQEIDDAVRVERLQQFWERSGNLVIAACVGIVALTVASVLWKNHQHNANIRQTSVLLRAEAQSASGKFEDAEKTLAKAEAGTESMKALTGLRRAEALSAAGQNDKAAALYGEIAAGHGGDDAIRDFAALQAGILAGNAHKPSDISKQTQSGRPFAAHAAEIQAVRLLAAGKDKEAATLLQTIADDATVPSSERARAMELLDTANEDRK